MKLTFSGNNAILTINVLSYAYTNANDIDDMNWLRCKILCQIGELKTVEDLFLQTSDFAFLQDSLTKFIQYSSDIVEFSTMEDQLYFLLQRKNNEINVKGKISSLIPKQATFTFEFVINHSINSLINDLVKIILAFPVKNDETESTI